MLLITYLGSGYLYTGELSNITLRIEILNFYYVFTCILYFIDLKGLCCVYKKYFQVRLGFFFNKFGDLDPLDFFTEPRLEKKTPRALKYMSLDRIPTEYCFRLFMNVFLEYSQ